MSSETEGDPWIDLPGCSWQADGRKELFVTVRQATESGSRRIAKRDRPFQEGAKLDDVGGNAKDFSLSFIFHNDVEEPDLNNGMVNWPNAHNELLDQFDTGNTGTLNLPWKRGIRCKAASWQSMTSADSDRGGALVTANFTTDNEDSIDREAVEQASVSSTVAGSVEAATFDMDSVGMFDGSIEDITELAANLVGLLNAPGEQLAAVLHAANRVRRAVTFVLDSFSSADPGRNQMNDADGSNARLKLLELLELAGRAEGEALARSPATRTVFFPRVRDLASIASDLGQSYRTLLGFNGQLEDPAYIPAGTPVRILAE